MDRNRMKMNAEKVMGVMKAGYRYTLSKLEEITAFGTTELCMAILLLIRDDRVKQFQCEDGVCYVLTKAYPTLNKNLSAFEVKRRRVFAETPGGFISVS